MHLGIHDPALLVMHWVELPEVHRLNLTLLNLVLEVVQPALLP